MDEFEVCIAGAGACGLFGAVALASGGIRVCVLEKESSIGGFGVVEIEPEIRSVLCRFGLSRFFEDSKNVRGKVVLQRRLIEALLEAAYGAGVEIRFDAEVVDVEGFIITYGNKRSLHAPYLVGADGSESFVRRRVFETRGCVFDTLASSPGTYCVVDKTPPVKTTQRRGTWTLGPSGLVRLGFFLRPNESAPEGVAAYSLKCRVASMIALDDKAFLIGDAAHSFGSNPSVNHGIRSALNLAWKLYYAIRFEKTAPLATFEPEMRRRALSLAAARGASSWVWGKQRGRTAGLKLFGATPGAGTLFPEPYVVEENATTRHVLGRDLPMFSFHVVGLGVDPQTTITIFQTAKLLELGFRFSTVLLAGDDHHLTSHDDLSHVYHEVETTDILRQWRRRYQNPDVVVVRPDLYVFAGVKVPDLHDLLDALLTLLHQPSFGLEEEEEDVFPAARTRTRTAAGTDSLCCMSTASSSSSCI
ncbi:hypothetical protein CTAYLR_004103 [Chrysophaeum taylorii]|uniref:FAD-binding domain-containing protein n=1 Tax=Chrysophaeum taylorii TaxID=2483200 RepID=A0AAD7UCW2_9STRA|nr:hypothetical protein CTAYLR_004103 [Chrysophaeum taylorii]